MRLLQKIKKWLIEEEFIHDYCSKHPTHKTNENYFAGCMACWREKCEKHLLGEREIRIEETKEAIVRAHKEINDKEKNP